MWLMMKVANVLSSIKQQGLNLLRSIGLLKVLWFHSFLYGFYDMGADCYCTAGNI